MNQNAILQIYKLSVAYFTFECNTVYQVGVSQTVNTSNQFAPTEERKNSHLHKKGTIECSTML